jgi:hypothetical protein
LQLADVANTSGERQPGSGRAKEGAMKKAATITFITMASLVVLLVVGILLVPILFKDRILERVRFELNQRLDATVALTDVNLTLLSTFPTLTAEVTGLEITGKGEFEGIKLWSSRSIAAGVDPFKLIRQHTITIESVEIDRPEVRIVVTEDGKANYDIVKELPEPEEEPSEALVFEIRRYRVDDGALTYDEPGIEARIEGLNHRGRVKVAGATQELASETRIEELSVNRGGITYVKKAKASVEVAGTIRTAERTLQLDRLELALNELGIGGSGTVGWGGEGIDLDVELASKKGLPIKALISAIPNAYAADFEGMKASGAFSLAATAKGQLGPDDDDIPSFSVTANVRDGTLKYPDLPLGITDLELDARLDHPGGNLDKLKVAVPKYRIAAGKSHAKGSLSVTRPISQPHIDLLLDGRFDLADIAKAYPIPDVEAFAGLLEAYIDLSAKGDQIEKLTGHISVADVVYRPVGAPEVVISAARVVLSPQSTRVEELRAKVGASDVSIRGQASPLTTFLMDDREVTATASIQSNNLRVEDFLGEAKPAEGATEGAAKGPPSAFVLPDDVDAKLDLDVRKLTYGDLELRDLKGSGRLRDQKVILEGVRAKALGGAMKLDGTLATPPGAPAIFDMVYAVDKVSFAQAFEALPSMRTYAPIARFLDGRFSTDLRASGTLGDDLSPKLDSIDAAGLVAALQSTLSSSFEPLRVLSGALPAVPKPLGVESFKTRFAIKDGAVEVKPFTVNARGLAMQVSGTHGLDQEMKYQVSTEVPINTLTSKLAAEVKGLGLDLAKVKTVGVRAVLTGSIQSPRVSVNVDTSALRGAVADAVSAKLAEQRARAMKEAEAQAQKLVAEAEKRAEQIRREAKKAAEKLRKEGYARADQVEREGAGNPLTKIAAQESAKRIRRETDQRVEQLKREADRRADQAVAEAKKRAAQAVDEAAKRSEQVTEAAEKQTTGKLR